jgi:IS6 family transposase
MTKTNPLKWCHFESETIQLCVRWYLRYSLSYQDLKEIMQKRGLSVVHTTIYPRGQRYAPKLDEHCRAHLKPTNDSYRVDETYVKVKERWKYLYREVDSEGYTIDFLLCAERDAKAAKRFFCKALMATYTPSPKVINVDGNLAYPSAFEELKDEEILPEIHTLRSRKYLNNIIEQHHRFIKRRVKPGLRFWSFQTAWRDEHDSQGTTPRSSQGRHCLPKLDDCPGVRVGCSNTLSPVPFFCIHVKFATELLLGISKLSTENLPI